MKKLLLGTAAVGLAFTAMPAHADIDLDVGGYFKGYGVFVDQDENGASDDVNDFDFIRDTEIHLSGETTLDNGLTVGAHFEFDVDGGESTEVDESYVYFSGAWGRVNFGAEDGAAYLLQVAAPSADSNIDGVRQYLQPVNYTVLTNSSGDLLATAGGLDYDQDITGKSDKLTYMTPIFNGFQAGLTYTPDSDGQSDDLEGIGLDDEVNAFGAAYEAAIRYEGQIDAVGFTIGAGYSHAELEQEDNPIGANDFTDDRTAWNAGIDLDIGPFGLGFVYAEDDRGEVSDGAGNTGDDEEIMVVGADYTTGAFKLGATYYNSDNTFGVTDLETDRYTGGVVYTYGPGMTFRGSVSYVEHELDNIGGTNQDDVDATSVVLGTQIKF